MRGFSLSEYTTVQPPFSSCLLEYSAPVSQLRIITHASDIVEHCRIVEDGKFAEGLEELNYIITKSRP